MKHFIFFFFKRCFPRDVFALIGRNIKKLCHIETNLSIKEFLSIFILGTRSQKFPSISRGAHWKKSKMPNYCLTSNGRSSAPKNSFCLTSSSSSSSSRGRSTGGNLSKRNVCLNKSTPNKKITYSLVKK